MGISICNEYVRITNIIGTDIEVTESDLDSSSVGAVQHDPDGHRKITICAKPNLAVQVKGTDGRVVIRGHRPAVEVHIRDGQVEIESTSELSGSLRHQAKLIANCITGHDVNLNLSGNAQGLIKDGIISSLYISAAENSHFTQHGASENAELVCEDDATISIDEVSRHLTITGSGRHGNVTVQRKPHHH